MNICVLINKTLRFCTSRSLGYLREFITEIFLVWMVVEVYTSVCWGSFTPVCYRVILLQVVMHSDLCQTFQILPHYLSLSGLSSRLPRQMIQLSTRWWWIDSFAPLFSQVWWHEHWPSVWGGRVLMNRLLLSHLGFWAKMQTVQTVTLSEIFQQRPYR